MTHGLGLPATRIAELVRRGELSPRDVVTTHLERTIAYDGLVGAFRKVRDPEVVRAEADALAARPGLETLPLAGVPVAVKDNVAVAGESARSGSTAVTDARAREDHEVVRRLRAAGALVVGLTRMPELGVFASTDGALGLSRNPWDPSRTPGGSSGGSAAAVSAAMVPVAHGNDGMGSIRIPAACCGLVGLKPGRGLVPAGIGAVDWYGMAENGPLATTVADAALMLSVMAGRPDLAEVRPPSQRLRVAFATDCPVRGVRPSPDDRAAVESVARLLADAGHHVVPEKVAYPTTAAAAALARWFAGAAADAEGLPRAELARRTRVHAGVGRLLRQAGFPRPGWARAWQQSARALLSTYDVLVTPVLARTPPSSSDWAARGWLANLAANTRYAPYAAPWNLAGVPAMTVPAGRRPDGLPVAVQLVAGDAREGLLLSVASVVEDRLPWTRHAPTLATPPSAG